MAALQDELLIPRHAMGMEGCKDLRFGPRHFTRGIDVVNTNKPGALVCFCIKKAGECRNQRPHV